MLVVVGVVSGVRWIHLSPPLISVFLLVVSVLSMLPLEFLPLAFFFFFSSRRRHTRLQVEFRRVLFRSACAACAWVTELTRKPWRSDSMDQCGLKAFITLLAKSCRGGD